MKVLLSKLDIWNNFFAKIKTFVPWKNKGTKKNEKNNLVEKIKYGEDVGGFIC
jgi:hypothetical protein